jgi:hypothetical protein
MTDRSLRARFPATPRPLPACRRTDKWLEKADGERLGWPERGIFVERDRMLGDKTPLAITGHQKRITLLKSMVLPD